MSQMPDAEHIPGDGEKVVGGIPTPEESELSEWGRRASAAGLETLHTALTQRVTLAASLLGGAAAFLTHTPMPDCCRVGGATLLLTSLVAAIIGSAPREARMQLDFLDTLKNVRSTAVGAKADWLKVSSWSMVFGLAVFVVGMGVVAYFPAFSSSQVPTQTGK